MPPLLIEQQKLYIFGTLYNIGTLQLYSSSLMDPTDFKMERQKFYKLI